MVGLIKAKSVPSLLETLFQKNYFSYVDLAFAEKFSVDEDEKALLAYLFLASRKGHLTIHVGETLSPDPTSFLEDDTELCGLIASIKRAVLKAPQIVQRGSFYYLKSNFENEQKFLTLIHDLRSQKPEILIDIQNEISGLPLLPLQKKAVIHAVENSFTVLVGGPGTGKTYTAAHFLAHFWKCLSNEKKAHFEVAIAAPTGKAASHLQMGLKKILKDETLFSHLESSTLHSLLGIRQERDLFQEAPKFLTHDLVIVDESSMIDVKVMLQLLSSMKKGARLLLIGDPYQLPPVEAGSLFADLCDVVDPIELQECMRSELHEIITLASKIKNESPNQVIEYMKETDVLIECSEESLLKLVEEKFYIPKNDDYTHFLKFRMLSPLRKGCFGVDTFNQLCFKRLKEKSKGKFVAPILLTESDYKNELFNGETGLLIFNQDGKPNHAVFGSREIAFKDLPRFEYAYLLSVHKSQGSEFDEVLLLMPEGASHFGKELFYTAVTRAKKKIQVVGKLPVLQACLQKNSRRFSSITHLI